MHLQILSGLFVHVIMSVEVLVVVLTAIGAELTRRLYRLCCKQMSRDIRGGFRLLVLSPPFGVFSE